MLKEIGVGPLPNQKRDVIKGWAPWDTYLHVPDPDALAAESSSRNVDGFSSPAGYTSVAYVISSLVFPSGAGQPDLEVTQRNLLLHGHEAGWRIESSGILKPAGDFFRF